MKTKKKISKKAPKSSSVRKSAGSSSVACKLSKSEASFSLNVKTEGLEPIFASAYLMMDKAFVSLSGDREKTIVVALRAKDPKVISSAALAAEFLLDLASQKIRWAVSKNNLPIREFIAEQAVLIANGTIPPPSAAAAAPPEPTSEQLTDDQRAEIEKLIAEVESEIKSMNDKKINADPKGVKASWEEKQESGNKA
jgi:His-Xaa-Ser system protein HxsD